jgi:Kef-type K+ transport system membrane component KefB
MEIAMSDRNNIDAIRSATLDQIARARRNQKLALCGAAIFEAWFLLALLLAMEFDNKLHLLIMISTVGSYTIVVLGLIVLGAYVNRVMLRNLRAMELIKDEIITELRKQR